MELCRAHLIITGRVQGVFFRVETARALQPLNVRGWVRNLPNGAVEVLLEGEKGVVEQAIQWCWQGPPRARVDHVQVDYQAYVGDLQSFEITH